MLRRMQTTGVEKGRTYIKCEGVCVRVKMCYMYVKMRENRDDDD